MKALITRWLKVYEDEVALFIWMTLLFFFIRSSNIVLNNFVETTFLKRFGVEYLPAMTAINAVVTFVLLNLLAGPLSRMRSDRVMGQTMLVCGGIAALLRFVVPLDFGLLYPLLYILKTQFDVLQVYLFWNLGNDLFSTRQSKRLFPLITVGGIVGGIAGSFGTPLLAHLVAPDNLLILFALVSVAGTYTARRLGTHTPAAAVAEPPATGKGKTGMLGELRKVSPLLKRSTLAVVLLLFTLMPNIVTPIMTYQFSVAVDTTFTSEAEMLGFFSYFRGAQNVISLVLTLFVSGLASRFGLPVALLFHPLNFLLVFGAFLFGFNIWTAIYAGLSVNVIRTTINIPSTSALYGLLLPEDRGVLRPFLRGTVVRVGILTGSALLLIGNNFMEPRYLSLLALIFVGIWVAAALVLKKGYAGILLDLLRRVLPDFYQVGQQESRALLQGVDVAPVLVERFHTARPEETLTIAEALQPIDAAALDRAILARLPGLDEATQIALLAFLSEDAGDAALAVFRDMIDPDHPALMIALARTAKRVAAQMPEAVQQELFETSTLPEVKACFSGWLARTQPAKFAAVVEQWLDSDALDERRAGVIALVEAELAERAGQLQQMLNSETDPAMLALLLRGLNRLQPQELSSILSPWLQHPDETVRLAAVTGLSLTDETAIRSLILVLGDPVEVVRNEAIQKLTETAPDHQTLLVEALAGHSRRIREGLIRVAGLLDLKETAISRFYLDELKAAYRLTGQTLPLEDRPESTERKLLSAHFEERRRHHVANVTQVLAARDPSGQLALVQRGLDSGHGREQSDSVEALDTLLNHDLSKVLLPMLENQSRDERLAVARRHLNLSVEIQEQDQFIAALLRDPDEVTVLLAIELLTSNRDITAHHPRLEQLSRHTNPHIAKAAQRAMQTDRDETRSPLLERVEQLRRFNLFAELTVAELTTLAAGVRERQVQPGEELPEEGLHLVLSGSVSSLQSHSTTPGEERTLHEFGPQQNFGELTLFGLTPAGIRFVATEPTVLLHVTPAVFETMTHEVPEIALQVCRNLGERMAQALTALMSRQQQPEPETPEINPATASADEQPERPLNLWDRLLLLQQNRLFQQLAVEDLTAIATVTEELSVETDEMVISAGEVCSSVYLVARGEVTIEKTHETSDAEVSIIRLGEGETFALFALFGIDPEVTVRASSPALLLKIDRTEFQAIAREHPRIVLAVGQIIATRFNRALSLLQNDSPES